MLSSSQQVAKKLGITSATLSRYLSAGKIPKPKTATSGGMTIYLWTEEEIEHIRKLLPKIANGRKTRYQKLRDRAAQAGAPTLHKKKTAKKKTTPKKKK